jgi:hypothetical protein
MVTMVLLNEAWTCAIASATLFLTFFRTRAVVAFAMSFYLLTF